MIELYLSRQMHIQALKGTPELACIERQIIAKTVSALTAVLGLSDLNCVDEIERRVLQSSRRLYIGHGVSESLQAAKSELVKLIFAMHHHPEAVVIRQVWFTEFYSEDRYAMMVTMARRNSDFEVVFEWLVRHDLDERIVVGLNCFHGPINSEIGSSLEHHLVSMTSDNLCGVSALFDYIFEVDNQGLHIKDGEWVASEFSEFSVSELLLELLPVSLGYTKSDWSLVCQVFDENAYLAHFDEKKLTKSDAIRYLAHYLSSIKEEDSICIHGTVWPSVIGRSLLYFLLTHHGDSEELLEYSELMVSKLRDLGRTDRQLRNELSAWFAELVTICDMSDIPIPSVIKSGNFVLYIDQSIEGGC
ncbi:hypothetical protein ACP3V3_02970 [Vibrio sp. PNB22_3_1]